MKRILPLLLIVAILAGGVYLVSNYQSVTVRLNLDITPQADSTVWTSGMIEADDTTIVAEINGRVVDILADEGDEVKIGSVLIRLDTAVIDDQINGAQATVHTAQANLDAALKPVRDEEIAIARAKLAKAKATRGGAARTLQNAIEMRDNPLELNAQVNEARSQVEIAAKQVEAAQA